MPTVIAPTLLAILTLTATSAAEGVPPQLRQWLKPQSWQRDTAAPIVALGKPGAFDDQHIFAPCVAHENGRFLLWYCGARGAVADRVFQLGLATSGDGKQFHRHANNPVFSFGDGKRSVLTPTLLRSGDGAVLREQGKLRLWFSATDFHDATGLHTLHETQSLDGIDWQQASPALLDHVYAPTILKDGERYRMWYTDVSRNPWCIGQAESSDGKSWRKSAQPVLQIDQAWESGRLFYPTVVKARAVYLMWYGSYWSAHKNKTALGFAVSSDGLRWHKHPDNPVLRPDAGRPWESHYTTSQSVLRLPDGTWRMWYATRKSPPFVNKYFALGTAIWRDGGH